MTLTKQISLNAVMTALEGAGVAPGPDDRQAVPRDTLEFLARLRLLMGVPFNTLVPDEELLPNESIRFFFLDRAWTDALVQGALSVATTNSVDRAQLEAIYPIVEKDVDFSERRIRVPGGETPLGGTAGLVTGFLMRSGAVAGWPGMHIRAYREEPDGNDETVQPESDETRIKLLRLERLAPSVLLALFDGAPSVIHIEEPRQGVQFGTRLTRTGRGQMTATVPARNVQSARYVDDTGTEIDPADVDEGDSPSDLAHDIPVRFRPGAAGVIDMTNTARAFRDAPGTGMTGAGDDRIDGAEFALQMLRFPYRQVFAQSETTPAIQDAAFQPGVRGIARAYSAAFQAAADEEE
ncbi:hypothetical protein [Roseobacter sp.]|uniref:hypothetical protein n=1 Tax=Roseobacter sp. TaxID=1907202 RepID=UPI003296B063